YSVGKFNATAAVGGYRDEQAIAVGVGYRFTENVAGKVAVAAGGSSASWIDWPPESPDNQYHLFK
ncbi:YadA-like family protein, partial [Escherichia coli]|nr:YadA-like family protein [Escherichia coli]